MDSNGTQRIIDRLDSIRRHQDQQASDQRDSLRDMHQRIDAQVETEKKVAHLLGQIDGRLAKTNGGSKLARGRDAALGGGALYGLAEIIRALAM